MSDYIESSEVESFINDGSISESSWSEPEYHGKKKKVNNIFVIHFFLGSYTNLPIFRNLRV